MSENFYEENEITCLLLNLLFFLVFLGLEIYVLVKIKFKLEVSGIVTLSLYTLCLGIKVVQWMTYATDTGSDGTDRTQRVIFKTLNSCTERLKWFILYFFVFEMKEVKIKLMS